ncbi:MAG: hypothetical protein ACLPV4_14745 [Solirubrobacteraceae bacterium]
MTGSRWAIEIGIAVALVIAVLVIEPGVAFGGVIALVLLAACAASPLLHRRRLARPRPRARRR